MIFADSVVDGLLDFDLLGPITAHQMLLIVCGVFMIALFGWAARALPAAPKPTGLLALLEYGMVWVRDDVVYPWLGPDQGRRYLPLLWTLFFFILFSNLFGLMPFPVYPSGNTDAYVSATGDLAVTGGLAVITFAVVQLAGMRKHGLFRYWASLVPPGVPKPLVPIIFLIELIGLFTKPFALTVRLFANMLAGHAMLGILFGFLIGVGAVATTDLVPTIPSLAFILAMNIFEVLICLIQAYIFTVLTAIFISLSVAESH